MNSKANLLKVVREQFTPEGWRKHGDVIETVLEAIQSHQQSRRALNDLIRAGCNPAVLLREIGIYCGSGWDPDELSQLAKHARTQLKAIATRLEGDAEILKHIVTEFMELSADLYGDALRTPAALENAAKSLKAALATLMKHTHGKTGTTKHLVYLSHHIRVATGHPLYNEIARLLAWSDPSSNLINLADSLRHEIQSHEKQFPQLFQEEKAAIERDFRAWRNGQLPIRSSES